MRNALIVWAPDNAGTRRAAEAVRAAFDEAGLKVRARKASEASIVDIAAAELVVFATGKEPSAEVPPDYAELLRVFKGVTLAGRTAALFSVGSESATARLREALKDAEIHQVEEDPVFRETAGSHASEIADWARGLAARVEDNQLRMEDNHRAGA